MAPFPVVLEMVLLSNLPQIVHSILVNIFFGNSGDFFFFVTLVSTNTELYYRVIVCICKCMENDCRRM